MLTINTLMVGSKYSFFRKVSDGRTEKIRGTKHDRGSQDIA